MTSERILTPLNGTAHAATAATNPEASPSNAQASLTTPSSLEAHFPGRVLTVGDGNFSYSLALARQQHQDGGCVLTATSYDSYDELVDKYPESARICEHLEELGACVRHRVDATNLRASLGKREDVGVFDRIVFNHPHCGEENVRRHQSLLSHFYASALEILAANGRVLLTLAEGQPERWEALKRAQLAGLKLSEQVDDVDAHPVYGLRYERKRHQNGKSFHQVMLHGEKKRQLSTLFIFARASGIDGASSCSAPEGSHASSGRASGAACEPSGPTRKRKAEVKPKQKKQKKSTLAETPTDLVCQECDKSFKSAQGLKTHVHMVHELQAAGPTAPAAAPLQCEFCDRTFKNEDAQQQHRLAKHGKDQLIKPDWYVTTEQMVTQQEQPDSTLLYEKVGGSSGATQATPKACSICRLEFATTEEFDRHWTKLQPKQVEEFLCTNCERSFGEERALRQHQNFCFVKVRATAAATDGNETARNEAATTQRKHEAFV
jgi:hypothetical protein